MFDDKTATEARRRFLKGAITTAALALTAVVAPKIYAAGENPHLTDSDPAAKAMDYVEDATSSRNKLYTTGSMCANCQLYTGAASGYGPCQLFPGKLVNAKGWCTSYTPKA